MNGKRWVLTSAMLVAGIRLWMQLRGKTKTPFGEWAVGWGVTFFFVAMLSEEYPQAAGALAGTIVVGAFLVNGASLFEDMTSAVSSGAGFVDKPFAPGSQAAASPAGATTGAHSTASGHGANLGGPYTPTPHGSLG